MTTGTISSWNGQLPNDVDLDSGVLYIGSSVFSAQEGGLKYDENKTIRQIAFDGQRSPIAGLDRTVEYKPKISGTIIQVPIASLESMNPGMGLVTVAGGPSGATQLQSKVAGVLYAAADYLANVKAIWERGDGTYFQVRFPKAVVVKWDVAGTDKQEAKWNIEIEARLDMTVSGAKVSDPPMVYEYFAPAP